MADRVLIITAVILTLLLCSLLYTFTQIHAGGSSSLPDELHTCRYSPPPGFSKPAAAHPERVVLVTGAAGFVGYHVSRALLDQWGATVVGLDLFTDYYDVQLKYDRSNELIKAGAILYRGDVCDGLLLSHLFQKYNFTDVVHMAAQAGIRHSLNEPVTYAHTNIQCYLTLMDILRDHTHTSLIYASTSSVYGPTSALPFTTSSQPRPPTNIYSASKLANEHFSEAYCTSYSVRSIGVRLFTVYGPWGRPDMAIYKFTESIKTGRPLLMFKSTQPLFRDFTFVNDTVGVVLAAMDHTPSCCGEIYNAGRGKPEGLESLVEYLEEEFNTKSVRTQIPLLSCDLHMTWADMELTKKVLGYQPRVDLREGLREFVHWYREYNADKMINGAMERNKRLETVLRAHEKEVEHTYRLHVHTANVDYKQRLLGLKEKYLHYAGNRGIEVPDTNKKGFIYYPGIESPGYTIIKAPGYHGNIMLLKQRCLATEQCVAFTVSGEFKNQLAPFERWTTGPNQGMFVADMDICSADLHDCSENADCAYTGPGNYTCVCHHGYVKLGKLCVEKYIEGVVSSTEGVWQLSDQMDGFDWQQFAAGSPFVFFQGIDSPGGDYLVVEGGASDVGRLERACSSTHHCLGFNTNGILKHSLRPPESWIRWAGSKHSEHGLYVLDSDYCSLAIEQCPAHSRCQRQSPGNYSCVCQYPWGNAHNGACTLHDKHIHIILSTDAHHLPGLMGVVNSAFRHTSRSHELIFHIVFIGSTRTLIDSYLGCYGYRDSPQIEVVLFGAEDFKETIKVYSKMAEVGDLASVGNFARFYFHSLFPGLRRAVYLDVDTVVMGDVGELWEQLVITDKMLLAAPRLVPTYGDLFSSSVQRLFLERYGYEFNMSAATFNAGMYGINLDFWRAENLHGDVAYWMEQQSKEPLWMFGTQPILLLLAHGRWGTVDWNWNVNGLGWNKDLSVGTLEQAKLLHWSGKRKPWMDGGLYKELWNANILPPCTGHGVCVPSATDEYACQCIHGYTGTQCHKPPGALHIP